MSNRGGYRESVDLKKLIHDEALRLGFSNCGFTLNDSLEEKRDFYSGFIKQHSHSGLDYLETYFEKRLHPELLLEGTRTVIALLMNYFPPEIIPEEDNFVIAKYAYGSDYHVVMKDRISELVNFLKQSGENVHAKAFVDSGPVLEKAWAQKSGVGWQGKNTLLINKSSGSFFFIGIILTDIALEPDPPESDHCGNCRNCVSACPTGALDVPYQLDIPKCIAFQTIENKEDISENLKSKLNNRIYGCDICQDVCPYNRFASPQQGSGFKASERLLQMRKNEWFGLTESEFDTLFEDSPVKRIGYQRLMKNIRS